MAITVLNIIPRKHAESSETTQYTSTSGKTVIDKFTATNTSGVPVVLSVSLVVNGGAAGSANRVLVSKTIVAGETYTCPELVGQSLEAGGFISTLCSAAGSLVLSATGRFIS